MGYKKLIIISEISGFVELLVCPVNTALDVRI